MNEIKPGRVWVKICGITKRDDALAAIDSGADALGFNLWSGSKRYVSLEENAAWIAALPKGPEKIAVVVNPTMPEAIGIVRSALFDALQFHGDEDAAYLAEFSRQGHPFIVARRLQPGGTPVSLAHLPTERLLIDAAVPGEFGGTGVMLDFQLAGQFVQGHPGQRVILAGGLTPENVAEAVRRVRPFGVDVASGVETTPRSKDLSKVQRFIAAAHQAQS